MSKLDDAYNKVVFGVAASITGFAIDILLDVFGTVPADQIGIYHGVISATVLIVNRGRAEEAPPARRARAAGARTRFPIPSDGAYGRQRTSRASAASPGAGADSMRIAGVKTR